LKKEQERMEQYLAEMEKYKASITEQLAAAEKAEARVKGHLRAAREEKTSEYQLDNKLISNLILIMLIIFDILGRRID